MTVQSTLDIVAYLCADCNFKYVLTSKLSQDKLENLFGIVRQFNGTNDHPTPAQFLATLNVLAFYNLARPPKGGNCDPQTITALLGEAHATCRKSCPDVVSKLDKLVDVGNLEDAEHALNSFAPQDHEYLTQNSPTRLVYYVAGYVARKMIQKTDCRPCSERLTIPGESAGSDARNEFIEEFDRGGLLYPSGELARLVTALEDSFTVFFSHNKITAASMTDLATFLQGVQLPKVGCCDHGRELTLAIAKFYILLRFRFYAKSLKWERAYKR